MRGVPAAAIAVIAVALGACGRGAQPEEARAVQLPVAGDPTISLSVSFRVGSQDDPPGKEGLSFLTGQMIAEASTEMNSLEAILEKLYPLAAGYQIRVDRELTTLTGRTHRDNLAAYVELFTDAYLRPAFLDTDFQRVKSDTINYLENTLRYSSDEELGKATLYDFAFAGTPYAHPPEGTIAGLESITLDDVRSFYRTHYTRANAHAALGGGFDADVVAMLEHSLTGLPEDAPTSPLPVSPPEIPGRRVVLISKPSADASISFGFPIDVLRGEPDFYALWIANSWLGEHRNQASHLFQVIRETRGLNYGDYSYIEAFPEGGRRTMPPVNVPRRHQLFELWIRTLPNEQAHFALRAAIRELEHLVDDGLTEEQFELTRKFLRKYALHFADTTSARLGYAVDDEFYGIGAPGHLEHFRAMMDELTLEDVNAAITKHLQYDDLEIAIVTGDAEKLREALLSDEPSPMEYETPKSTEVLDEDREIAGFPLKIAAVDVVPVDSVFEK